MCKMSYKVGEKGQSCTGVEFLHAIEIKLVSIKIKLL